MCNDRSRLVGTMLVMLLIFFMSLFHIYLCCCIVRAPLCYLCSENAKCICVSCENEMCVWRPVFCFFGLGDRFLGAGVCCHLPSKHRSSIHTHLMHPFLTLLLLLLSLERINLAQPLLPSCVVILVGIHFEFFACGNPLCNMFVHCVWIFNHHQLHNTLVVSRHSMTTMFLYMSSV